MSQNPFLLSPEALQDRLGTAGLSVVDASWYMPAEGRDAKAEFLARHVPGAVFFDHDGIVDPASGLPHTLPSSTRFAEAAGALGIRATDTIVVYDGLGLFSAPRVWWMFRTFGARDVFVLDGGFPAWIAAGLPAEAGEVRREEAVFEATFDPAAVANLADMRGHVERRDIQIVDARSAERFAGSVPEPRPGVRGGHMPGSVSLPFPLLGDDGRLKPAAELRRVFTTAGIDPDRPVVTSCGSGVTAAVLNLALESLGNRGSKLYDGSWTEWGSAADTPVERGSETIGDRS